MAETMTLPSGASISVDQPDFSRCKTAADFLELKYALNEKIIEIELQIDLFHAGCIERPDPSWLPRAKAALRWAKLYRDEAQNRQGHKSSAEKQIAHAAGERCVIDILKAVMRPDDFAALIKAAETLKAERLNTRVAHG